MEDMRFSNALKNVKVPVLILDQKWHRLFALGGKPDIVSKLETSENELLKRQAELKEEIKDLKRVRESLMSSVMNNMEGTSDLISKKLDDDKRLLEECKERLAAREDELLDIPAQLDETNFNLMLETMNYCYDKLRTNTVEAEEIMGWINDVRVQLKKNVIRKHNREINNKEIYSYMHDVFGLEVLNLFDMNNGDFLLNIDEEVKTPASKTIEEADKKLDSVDLEEINLDEIEKESPEGEEAEPAAESESDDAKD